MTKRTIAEVKSYAAPGHSGCTTMRIHGKEETGAEKFWIGISTFLPGGGAEYGYEDNPFEKVYHILEGQMVVTDKAGNRFVLEKGDTLTILPFEGRTLVNETNMPARMLVVFNYPEEA